MKYVSMLFFLMLGACSNAVLGPLYNQSENDVREAWGNPTSVISENNRQMWSYRQGECTKLVFFNEKGIAKDGQELGVCPKQE